MLKMKNLLATLLFILSYSVLAETSLPRPNIEELDKTDRLNLVSAYRDFVLGLEELEGMEEHSQYSMHPVFKTILSSFYVYAAAGESCIYAGWPSQLGSSGFCERPESVVAYSAFEGTVKELGFQDGNPEGFQKCSSEERMCNPVLFGPVCVPFNSKYNRVRATSNCDKESRAAFPNGFDYASYLSEKVTPEQAEKLNPWFASQFADLQATSESVCTDSGKKQARSAVCRILEEKLKADFPYHSQPVYPEDAEDAQSEESAEPNMSRQKTAKYIKQKKGSYKSGSVVVKNSEPISEQGLKNLEYKIQNINLKVNNILKSKECTDPSVAKVTNQRYNTIQLMEPKSGEFLSPAGSECLKKLKPLLEIRTMLLKEYEKSFNEQAAQGCADDAPKDPLSLEKQATEMNKIVAEKACDANPQKWTLSGCGKDFACAIGSSIFFGGFSDKVAAKVGEKLGFKKGCLSSQNNCMAKIASAAANVIWSLLKSLPALAGMAWDGVKWVGKKVYSWMPWVTETEKQMSDANQAAMNMLGEKEESTLEKIGKFFSNMWTMLKEYVTDDLMCTEPGWETERFKSNAHCNQPFVSWNCLTCAGAISGVCNVVGAIGAEFLIGLLTGGTGSVVKNGTRAITLSVKAGARATLKKQMTSLGGKAFQRVVKTGVKTSSHLKIPVLLTRSFQNSARKFLKTQKTKFNLAGKWVSKNAEKVVTPIAKKSKFMGNVAELTIEGTGKAIKNTAKLGGKILTAPFKIPGSTIKLAGRIMDPFKLGEIGFALGFRATEGLFPMANFMRITNFGYDMANISQEIQGTSSATKAADRSADLLSLGSKQMDEWIRAANKGELSQAEFNQLEELLAVVKSTKTRFASNTKALDRMSDAEKKFFDKQLKLEEVLGQEKIKRFKSYSGAQYTGLEKGKIRNLKTGVESDIESVEVLRKQTGDIVLTIRPKNESVLVVDEIDGQLVAYTNSGEQVLISSGNLSKDANKLVHSKLKAIKDEERFADAQDLFKKGGHAKIKDRVTKVESADDLKVQGLTQKVQSQVKEKVDGIVSPIVSRIDRSALKSQINKAKSTQDFASNPEMQKSLDQQLIKIKDELVKKAQSGEAVSDLRIIAKDLALMDEAKNVASPAMKLQIEQYKKEIYKSLKDNASRNKLANLERSKPKGAEFGSKDNNVSVYENTNSGAKRTYGAQVTVKVDDHGVYARLDKNGNSEPLRLIDETENSFVGFNAEGQLVHIKKSTLDAKLQVRVSEKLSEIDPLMKEQILSKSKKMNERSLHPVGDPDFKYPIQLAKSEIRVGDDIVKLRPWQVGSTNMKENLVSGGSVTLKSSKGDAIKIENIHEQGDYWVGFSGPAKQKVLMPKFLLDSKTNSLMSRGRNFTKFKHGVKKRLAFVTGYNRKTKLAQVDKAFRAKYKYANYFIKYNMSLEAFKKLEVSTLEKIADKVYLHDLGDGDAEIIDLNENPISTEEIIEQEAALEEAVMSEEEFDFNTVSENDMDF